MKPINQLTAPILGNLPVFLLAWSVAGVITLVANVKACASLELGRFETVLNLALGTQLKTTILWLGLFYLFAGAVFAFSGKGSRLEEIEKKFLRPVMVPVIFQLAGFVMGIATPKINEGNYAAPIFLVFFIIAFALVVYNASGVIQKLKN